MTFYVVILGMCKFTVVNDRKGHGAIDFVYPGTYKVILRRQKFGQVRSKFYYIKQDFIVLRGSSNFFKVLCREFVIVHSCSDVRDFQISFRVQNLLIFPKSSGKYLLIF